MKTTASAMSGDIPQAPVLSTISRISGLSSFARTPGMTSSRSTRVRQTGARGVFGYSAGTYLGGAEAQVEEQRVHGGLLPLPQKGRGRFKPEEAVLYYLHLTHIGLEADALRSTSNKECAQ